MGRLAFKIKTLRSLEAVSLMEYLVLSELPVPLTNVNVAGVSISMATGWGC